MQLSPQTQAMLAGISQQDAKRLKDHIDKYVESALKARMEVVLQEVIKATPPYAKYGDVKSGGQKGGLINGRENIQRDIEAVFKTVRSVPFRQLVANRDWEAMAAYDLKFTNPQLEQALRDKKIDTLDAAFGHKFKALASFDTFLKNEQEMRNVHQQIRKVRRGGFTPQNFANQRFLVKDQKSINDYVVNASRSVGKMIWGWYDAAKQLGYSTLISPFGSKKTGGVVKLQNQKEMSLEVTNPFGDYDKILSNNLDCQQLVNDAAAKLEVEINNEINNIIASFLQTGQLPAMPQPQKPKAPTAPSQGKGGKTP